MKTAIFLILIVTLLTSCYSTSSVVSKTHDFSESMTFTVDKIQEGRSISTGSGYWKASKGYKYIFVFLTVKNNLNQKQELNFDDFILLNPRTKTRHAPKWSMVVSPVNMWGKLDSYIMNGGKKKRKLVYVIPKEDKAKMLLVNNKIVEIEYAR